MRHTKLRTASWKCLASESHVPAAHDGLPDVVKAVVHMSLTVRLLSLGEQVIFRHDGILNLGE